MNTLCSIIRSASRGIKSAAALTIAASIALASPSVMASNRGAEYAAQRLFKALKMRGWDVRETYTQGKLRRGESTVLTVTLYAGNKYTLAASGCEDAYDVDLVVYDENNNLIECDRDDSKLAVVDFSPRWTGTFYLKVTMHDSTYDGAHFVVQYAFTDA